MYNEIFWPLIFQADWLQTDLRLTTDYYREASDYNILSTDWLQTGIRLIMIVYRLPSNYYKLASDLYRLCTLWI